MEYKVLGIFNIKFRCLIKLDLILGKRHEIDFPKVLFDDGVERSLKVTNIISKDPSFIKFKQLNSLKNNEDLLKQSQNIRYYIIEPCGNNPIKNMKVNDKKKSFYKIIDRKNYKYEYNKNNMAQYRIKYRNLCNFIIKNGMDNVNNYNIYIENKNKKWLPSNQVISKNIILNHKISALIGQFGVYAKIDIPKFTVLGITCVKIFFFFINEKKK